METPLAETHLSSVQFRLPYPMVWRWLADPLHFPRLYPNWTRHVERRGTVYAGVGPAGDAFTIVPRLDEEQGIIDFEVADAAGHVELSRSRLFPLKTGGCVLVHLAVRWDGVDDAAWGDHQRGTDADLENARRLLEDELRAAERDGFTGQEGSHAGAQRT
jgi:hypothetical protein